MQQVVDRVREHFGVELASLDRVPGGPDSRAMVWRGRTAGGVSYAVKLSTGDLTAGLAVSSYLAAQGRAGVPAPLIARSGRPWADLDGAQLAVTPWVTSRRAVDGGLDADQWRSFGALLAGLHAVTVPADVAALLPTEDHVVAEVAGVRSLDARIDRSAPPDDPIARAVWESWPTGVVRVLVDRVLSLGTGLRRRPMQTVLCHGDAHTANLMVDGDRRLWLIDWDGAVVAPRERDLMFVLGGVLASQQVTKAEQGWFFEGYGPTEVDRHRLAYYRCWWALQDVGGFAAQAVDVSGPTEDRAQALACFRSLQLPTGIISLALS